MTAARRHGHAAGAVPRHLPRRHPLVTPAVAVRGSRRRRCAALVFGVRARSCPILRRIVRESLPILLVAGAVDVMAGITIEKQLESFLAYPALLVLVPALPRGRRRARRRSSSSRLASKLHLGTRRARARRRRGGARRHRLVSLLRRPGLRASSASAPHFVGRACSAWPARACCSMIGSLAARRVHGHDLRAWSSPTTAPSPPYRPRPRPRQPTASRWSRRRSTSLGAFALILAIVLARASRELRWRRTARWTTDHEI